MKLLVLTQKIDKEDSVLGFFHNWILKLSQKFEKVIVICLEKGESDFPQKVKVFSLGKESKKNKIKYIINLYKYIWQERKNYDAVFVHMNQEYVLLGGLFWKMLGKKVFMWRNHSYGNFLTRLAVSLSDKVFCTSPHSFTAQFKKTLIMPVGIDTHKFSIFNLEFSNQKRNKILFLSRIAPIKKPDLLIEALKILKEKNVEFDCNFYGEALPKDQKYFEGLKEKVKEYNLENQVKFKDAVPNYETPKIYNEHGIFINLTPSGSLDKTILEAAACGSIPVVINQYFKDIFEPEMLVIEDKYNIGAKIEYWLKASPEQIKESRDKLQKYVRDNHSLESLVNKLCLQIS